MTITSRDFLLNDPRVNAVARRKFLAVLADVRGHGLPLVVWEVYRSREKQRALYAQGRSDDQLLRVGYTRDELKLYRSWGYTPNKPIITKIINPRYHGTGRAMDCCWLVDGKLTWNVEQDWWQTYGSSAKAHELTWGGDWKMRDLTHVQLELKE